jgi:hypothetical protein
LVLGSLDRSLTSGLEITALEACVETSVKIRVGWLCAIGILRALLQVTAALVIPTGR